MGGKIGILALQGAFTKHEEILEKMGVPTIQVRYAHELSECIGLILPGGESTTITRHIQERELLLPLKKFAMHRPLFGTCAGMIVMARDGILALLNISIVRNAYGRQKASFITPLQTTLSKEPVEAFFIRAPRIQAIHDASIHTLGDLAGEPVLIQQNFHLATTFHPELTEDTTIHKYFYQLCHSQTLQFYTDSSYEKIVY